MITSEELAQKLNYCTGTEHYYRDPLLPFYYTDGVKVFVENAEASWFLYDLLTYIKLFANNYMCVVTLKVENEKAILTIQDDNNKKLATYNYSYTDCPAGEYRFYMYWKDTEHPVLIYYREY